MGLLIMSLLFAGQAFAQSTVTISGTVLDELSEPIIGGSVQVKDSKTAAATNIDGQYTIQAPANGTLVFSYLGYKPMEVPVASAKNGKIDVQLESATSELDELVVVGYGVMKKSDLTGSISQTKGSDIIKQQGFNALEGLKGKAAGVNIFNNTGQPGGEMRVIIRGISTINASASPLYIVDGVAMNDFNYVNPNDIESIEVLKDASATAIYGARGANGVVMVTPKRGDAGQGVKVSYDGSVSVSKMANKMDVMNSAEWMAAFKQVLKTPTHGRTRTSTPTSRKSSQTSVYSSPTVHLSTTQTGRTKLRAQLSHTTTSSAFSAQAKTTL